MAKPRTGTIEPFMNAAGKVYYRGKLRLADGSRERVDIDEPFCFDEEAAREFVLETQLLEDQRGERLARKLGQPPPASAETVADWGERWVKAREDKGYMSTRDDRGRIVTHVVPVIGSKPMATVKRSDIERVVEVLDTKVKTGTMSWKTALNVWGIVTKMFNDAQNSKQKDLRLRDDNPCERVAAPDRGAHKSQQFLYPNELVTVLNCKDVPFDVRRLMALAIYLVPRAAELEALDWTDMDMDRGVVHIHRAVDRAHGGEKATKTGRSRRFSVEANILPVLAAMHEESGGKGPIVSMPRMRDLAEGLRSYLKVAGVVREELYLNDDTRKAIRWHDLRATGCTWMAVRGDEPLHIQHRAGHTSFGTTQLYIRQGEALRDGFGEVFPPLPMLLERTDWSTIGPKKTATYGFRRGKLAERAGFEPAAEF